MKVEGGHPTFFGHAPLQVQLGVLVSAFVMASAVWPVSCLLFFYTYGVPRVRPFVKVGARYPCPMESASLYGDTACT